MWESKIKSTIKPPLMMITGLVWLILRFKRTRIETDRGTERFPFKPNLAYLRENSQLLIN